MSLSLSPPVCESFFDSWRGNSTTHHAIHRDHSYRAPPTPPPTPPRVLRTRDTMTQDDDILFYCDLILIWDRGRIGSGQDRSKASRGLFLIYLSFLFNYCFPLHCEAQDDLTGMVMSIDSLFC